MKKQSKTRYAKAYTREDFEENLKKTPRRKVMYPVNFEEIEDAPGTDLQRKAVEKMRVAPEALNKLMREEELEIVECALKEAPLTSSERKCLKWTLQGLEQREVEKKLRMNRKTVQTHLLRGREKLRVFVAHRKENLREEKVKNQDSL